MRVFVSLLGVDGLLALRASMQPNRIKPRLVRGVLAAMNEIIIEAFLG